jgi:hypothetical protein
MKYLLMLFLFSGCTNSNIGLNRRILTDAAGCKYMVSLGVGDTVFLNKLPDVKCEDLK